MKNKFIIILLLIIFLATSYTLFYPKFFRPHDYTHAARIYEMSNAILDGHLPVIWTRNFGFGYGMPLFQFYAPFPFYLGSVFYLCNLDLVLVIKILFILCNFFTILGAYLLGKNMADKKAGLLLTLFYSLAPYRAVNLFVRGAISESYAMLSYPWICLGCLLFIKKKTQKAHLVLLISLLVLFLSHNISTLIFYPFVFIFLIIFYFQEKFSHFQKIDFKKDFSTIFKPFIFTNFLALILASFYLLPAYFEKSYTQVEAMTLSGFFHYSFHFLYLRQFFMENWQYGGSILGLDDGISFFFGYGQIVALALVFVFLLANFIKLRQIKSFKLTNFFKENFQIFCLSLLIGTLCLLMTFKTQFIWDRLKVLQFVQFPWRYLSIVVLMIAMMTTSLSKFLSSKKANLIFFILFFSTVIYNSKYFYPDKFIENNDDYYYTDEKRLRSRMSDILKDYLTKDLNPVINPSYSLIDPNLTNFSVLVDKTQSKLISTDTSNEQDIIINLAYYPDWQVEIDGLKNDYQITNDGLIQVHIPAGKHLISVNLKDTLLRTFANVLTLFGIGLFIYQEINLNNDQSKRHRYQ